MQPQAMSLPCHLTTAMRAAQLPKSGPTAATRPGNQVGYEYRPVYQPSSTWKPISWTLQPAPANAAKVDASVIFRTNATSPNGSVWYRFLHVEKGQQADGPQLYRYDAQNRLTALVAAGGLSVGLEYDTVGNRTSMTDATGTTTYTYDSP